MWKKASDYLTKELPAYRGIDIECLIRDIDGVYRLVPASWFAGHASVDEVRALKLPVVSIRILDKALHHAVATWIPRPIEDL